MTVSDREAAAWGLLAWEDPHDEAGPASPLWSDTPMLEPAPIPARRVVTFRPSKVLKMRIAEGRADMGNET